MKRFLTATPEVAAKKARTDSQWDWTSSDESLLVGKFKVPAAYTKIAAFDFDGTLSVTVSGKSFPVGPEDARLLYPSKTRAAFRRLHDEGYCIVIFSNQNGVGSGKTTAADVKSRMSLVLGSVDVPCFCYCALLKDRFRKPAPGMWLRFLQDNALVEAELHPDSFFCGDAAGRTKPKKDFSDSDLKFSHNCGMAFYTPEEYFDGVPRQSHPVTGFDPQSLMQPVFSRPYEEQLGSLLNDIREHPNGKWMVLLVGYPAMGKTTLCKTMFPSFAYVN
jgi:bifunctional polynucleotide phosphatase/kinase